MRQHARELLRLHADPYETKGKHRIEKYRETVDTFYLCCLVMSTIFFSLTPLNWSRCENFSGLCSSLLIKKGNRSIVETLVYYLNNAEACALKTRRWECGFKVASAMAECLFDTLIESKMFFWHFVIYKPYSFAILLKNKSKKKSFRSRRTKARQ